MIITKNTKIQILITTTPFHKNVFKIYLNLPHVEQDLHRFCDEFDTRVFSLNPIT